MRTHLDLFSGIGGFAIAAQNCGFETVAFCEKEPYAQQILKERFGAVLADAASVRCDECSERKHGRAKKEGRLPESFTGNPRLHPDIFTLNGADYAGVDLLTGGFPCQPFSLAGKRRGATDDRALWPEMLRVIDGAKPAWLIGENVAGIVTMELDNILSDLEAIGYAAWPLVIPACAVDARHRRDRVWIVAHAEKQSERKSSNETHSVTNGRQARQMFSGGGSDVPDTQRRENRGIQQRRISPNAGNGGDGSGQACCWLPEPELGRVADELSAGMDGGFCVFPVEPQDLPRVAHGIKHRAHRLRGLGNAILPGVAIEIIRAIVAQEIIRATASL